MENQSFNSSCLSRFNNNIYRDVLSEAEIMGDEKALSDKETTGFILKKAKKVYFLPSAWVNNLPIRISDSHKIIDRTSVYHLIDKCSSVHITGDNTMDMRKLIDKLCNFKHTNDIHFTLYKIMCVCAYCGRVNWRVATPAAFGKDSVVDALRDLTNNCSRIDKASPAKLDYVLKFPFILCNEIASLKKEDKDVFLQFGLSAGAKQNKYTKPTRKSQGTKEIYDISKLSLCFTYNIASYYRDKGYSSFDESYPEQFLDRFIPFKMEGWIDVTQFKREGEVDFNEEYEKHKELYISILKKLVWLTNNPVVGKYKPNKETYVFGKGKYRWISDFELICDYISLYAKDKKEFDMLTQELYNCHNRYLLEEIEQNFEGLLKEEVIIK